MLGKWLGAIGVAERFPKEEIWSDACYRGWRAKIFTAAPSEVYIAAARKAPSPNVSPTVQRFRWLSHAGFPDLAESHSPVGEARHREDGDRNDIRLAGRTPVMTLSPCTHRLS
jgi:hypothetical protein